MKKYLPLYLLALLSCTEKKVDFSTEVKPILNKHCISCHGGVKKNAGFSLLFREEAMDTTESGKKAIVPGDPDHSEMIRRLTLQDPEERMPYKRDPLSQEEIDILKKWIEQGAPWGSHWAYIPPVDVKSPSSNKRLSGLFSSSTWARNDIDHFIYDALDQKGLSPEPEAEKHILLRRLYLDITGVPPTLEAAKDFLQDTREDAYERLVDTLLQSPLYGEKWASWWLDLARYSDTKGYEKDGGRTIWRYRDWVIKALNNDMPFNQFTIEQLAGDLLPNPTDDQLLATAFHRNTMNNDEGGTDDEEFRTASIIDRVATTWEVWQGTTLSCVQCHSHPYDPIHHEEYYKAFSFFNNTRDEDTEGEHPNFRWYGEGEKQKLNEIVAWAKKMGDDNQGKETEMFLKTLEPKYHAHAFDQFINGELIDTKLLGLRHGGSARLKGIDLSGKTKLIFNYWMREPGGSFTIHLDRPDGKVIATGKLIMTEKGRRIMAIPLQPTSGVHDLYFVSRNPQLKPTQAVFAMEWFAFRGDLPGKGQTGYDNMEEGLISLMNAPVDNTPIMVENPPVMHRKTYLFERGNWLVKGKEVNPGVPAIFNSLPQQGVQNRLDFARWMVDNKNPLTARVTVNRIWDQIFGSGLVTTLEDFGTQGSIPEHPALLDNLAFGFMNRHHWSLKKLIRDIVLSSTYRQASYMDSDKLEEDPDNRYFSRAPRLRLSAEQIRDQALAVSGLLSPKMYGKSVMPFQPEGIWQSVYNGSQWKISEGEDQYRRGLYTYLKRTSPYPPQVTFDGASREVCLGRRIRTNTPLQALVTLNDPVYIEAARNLAKVMAEKGKGTEAIKYGYERLVFHPISEVKLKPLIALYENSLKRFGSDETARNKVSGKEGAVAEEAALMVVANALLNLDEVLTKE